jgi:glucokinase
MKYTLGVDIGGTKCAVVLGRDRMTENVTDVIVDKKKFPTAVGGSVQAVIDDIIFAAEDLLEQQGASFADLTGIGVSCGGPMDAKHGLILSPPNLPGWDRIPITEILSSHFGVKTVLQNDANACAVAEWKYGAGKGMQNVVFLTFGTGMGAGLILNGQLYSGACDLAGEVGHIRMNASGPVGYGKEGSFEGYCSGGGIVNLAKLMMDLPDSPKTVLSDEETLTAKSISDAAKAGDKLAREVYQVSAIRLGQGLAVLVDLLNPDAIVIGSIYTRDTALFESAVKEVLKKEALPASVAACRILPAALGEHIGDIAALSLVLE